MTRRQIEDAIRALKLKDGLTRSKSCRVISEWLKMRAAPGYPERENLTEKQIRSALCEIQKALRVSADTLLNAPKTVRHEIAIELQGALRFHERMAFTFPADGMRNLIRVAEMNVILSESVSRTLRIYSTKGGRSRNRADRDLLLDLAELYEWLTGGRPTRKTKSYKHADVGKHFGEFYEFAKTFWFAYHNSNRGLEGALKTWATQRNKGARKSLFLRSILSRHPEWQ